MKRILSWFKDTRSDLSAPSLFVMLWCVAIISNFDDRIYARPAQLQLDLWVSVIAAYLGIFFARSFSVILCAFVIQAAACWYMMPMVDNHWFFTANVSAIFALSLLVYGNHSWYSFRDYWLEKAIPFVRILVILLYFFTFFHKLNFDFLDPTVSCAVYFYQFILNQPYSFPLPVQPPEIIKFLLIYGVLALELAIVVFLLCRRTWFLGIALGVLFHLLTGTFQRHFPTLMFALYVLFIPKEVFTQLIEQCEQGLRRMSAGKIGLIGFLQLQAFVWSGWSLLSDYPLSTGERIIFDSGYWELIRTWNVLIVIGFIVFAAAVIKNRFYEIPNKKIFASQLKLLYIFPLFFALNCLSPYFGLKTTTSMAMYSNLIASNNHSNHLIIRAGAFRAFPYMDDMVNIKEISIDGRRREVVKSQDLMAYSMLKREIRSLAQRGHRNIALHYDRKGKEYKIGNAEDNKEFMSEEPYLFRKLSVIKNTPKNNVGTCSW